MERIDIQKAHQKIMEQTEQDLKLIIKSILGLTVDMKEDVERLELESRVKIFTQSCSFKRFAREKSEIYIDEVHVATMLPITWGYVLCSTNNSFDSIVSINEDRWR